MLDLDTLRDQIRDFDWIVGAVNYDEDLHFSSYYLRASTPARTDSFYPGYGLIIGFYENFTERYFLKKDECANNAEVLTRRALRDPAWLRYILDEIVHRSNALTQAFPPNMSPAYLTSAPNQELLTSYELHHRLHTDLYTYARIPEALDRGVDYFTNYLRGHLTSKLTAADDLNEVFNQLTQPVTASVLAQAILDLERIVGVVKHDQRTRELLLSYPRMARMLLPYGILERVRAYAEKWRYLEYHGYGSRRVADEGSIVDQILNSLQNERPSAMARTILTRFAENRVQKDLLFDRLKLDVPHRELFELYPEIGAVKLHRRYAQLRNFYFLDMLLSEIAKRLQVDEWTIRSALPEEIMRALREGAPLLAEAHSRRSGCMFVLRNDKELLVSGDQIHAIQEQLETRSAKHKDRRILKGIIASKGRVQGVCKIILRADVPAQKFQDGAILVSEATDPDLLKLIRVAGGVLTQQGGVTAHAAIICREIGIPAIIGIEGLLDTLKDGDVVELDAFTGTVSIMQQLDEPPAGILAEHDSLNDPARVGAKAANLSRLAALGFAIPPYVVLKSEGVRRYLDAGASDHGNQGLGEWIQRRLSLGRDAFVAIRSSGIDEDTAGSSLAGEFDTIINLPIQNVSAGLADFLEKNKRGRGGDVYSGSIIVQEMIGGEIGGVSLTMDVEHDDRSVIICEMSLGGAQAVTSGMVTPARIRVRKDTLDILEASIDSAVESRFGREIVRELGGIVLDIENLFGVPVDVEWVKRGSTFFVLQARPIVIPRK